jgi:hypothetical protein
MMGALGSAELRNRFSADGLLRVLAVVACVAMVIIGQSRWMAVTLAAHVLAGSVWTLGFANFNIAVQLSSPRWVTGRMLAHYQTISFAAIALGSWLWGVAAHAEGLREALTVAGVVALFPLAVARWLPVSIPQLGALDPRERGAIAPPSVEIHAASGPVVVTIEYRVPAANAVEFVAVINELGRVRRRDGARSWSICQDIDEPDLWVERFEHPTWMDYLRWRGRRTESDRAMRARIDPLIDTSRILVRRLVERPAGADPLGTVSPPTPDRAVAGRERGPHGDLPA